MRYTLSHRWGDQADGDSFSPEELGKWLAELEAEDDEHPDISIVDNEADWTMSFFPSGLVVLENEDEIFHMRGLARADVLPLVGVFLTEGVDRVRREPWLPGYSS